MAGSIYQWSTTAANNGTADADVPWPEGMARRQVNDSARGIMGRAAEFRTDLGGSISAGGTANGLTVTAASAFTTYADGQIVSFRATADNTGAATLNVNGIGAKAIRKMDSTGDVALVAGEIQQTGIYVVQYQAALNGAAGAWLLVNPTLSAAIYALSGLTTTDNAIARFDSTAGKLQNSNITISDAGSVTYSDTDFSITADTSDASDTKMVGIGGGGSSSNARGARILAFGNEHATSPGILSLGAGATGSVEIIGDTALTGALTTSGAFTATGNITSGNIFATPTINMRLRPNGAASATGEFILATTGNITANGSITATSFSGSGASLTSLPAGQLTGTVDSARISGSYTGITGTGALNAGSITSGFGSINIGASTFTTTGTATAGTLVATGSLTVAAGSAAAPSITFVSDPNTGIYSGAADDQLRFTTAGTQSGRIDSSGKWYFTGSGIAGVYGTAGIAIFGSTSAAGEIRLRPCGDSDLTGTAGQMSIDSSGNVTASGDLIAGDDLFVGVTALINPAAAEYGMSADGGGLLTVSRNADVPLRVKRNGDGTLVAWYNGTTNVAVVSQASDVVTYGAFCGAHWAQWAGEPPVDVLRGTVLETADEMCAWDDTSNPEILPKVKVCDTPWSRKVYGVYSHPDSDGSDDFHVASLGAYVVRVIGPVENGDLLESAGDGCARVQESEVFTSRTIAKVTAAVAVETYPDGSKLYPATLHCG